MRESVRELLITVAYLSDLLMRPTFRNWTKSFEEWEYDNGVRRRVGSLERQRLIRRAPGAKRTRWELTQKGLLATTEGLNPEQRWNRPWQGSWWLVLFDLPVARPALRSRLLRWLRLNRFGCLQGSLWLTPDPPLLPDWIVPTNHVHRLIVMQGFCPPEYHQLSIVRSAWDFNTINSKYREHFSQWRRLADLERRGGMDPKGMADALRRERRAWEAAAGLDPFLPRALWPAGYLGPESWRRHCRLLGESSVEPSP